ncbi:cold-shock protein [Crassaminicella thermophila]|uniref:Cold-shock protein n=1 Tax=Crassaminicella thermophila TaxID=2599308 RepID=A0A5C0SGJ6_CRATE|nr:cold-inducible protein YdjO-related protein [Crassaminicella thermophila]QEK13320.1 cold-shock protein [Crassaminicella thermophila]
MFFKKDVQREEKTYEFKEVQVWQCPNCIGWMQKEFSVSENPTCPFCSSNMLSGSKEVKVLV